MDPHDALTILRNQRMNRQTFATTIADGLANTTFYSTNIARVERTIRQTLHEDDQYHTLTGEPMPDHHQRVLRSELSYWMAYDDLLRATPVPEEAYASFCHDLRVRAGQLIDLLQLQQELLGDPLVAHYLARVDRITGGTAVPNPTHYPKRALRQLREDRQERVRLAHNTYRHLLRETFFDAGTTDLTYAIKHAPEDQVFYEDATGEPYPAHAQAANALEIRCWATLLRVHERGTTHPARACRRLRPAARALERVLELSDELLTNPLVEHYTRTFAELERAVEHESR